MKTTGPFWVWERTKTKKFQITLILQRLYNISDAQAEYQIKGRLGFMRFPGLALCGTIPDEKTIWEENGTIQEGWVPGEREQEANRHKRRQKDTDARRAKKNKETHYGYKDHIKIDKKSKIITKQRVTSAEVHDRVGMG